MKLVILGIGLDAEMSKALSSVKNTGFNTIETENFDEALSVLNSTDLLAVLVNSQASPKIREDINTLLAKTSLTTKIVLITHPSDMRSNETFQALGVKTVDSPVSADMLEKLLS